VAGNEVLEDGYGPSVIQFECVVHAGNRFRRVAPPSFIDAPLVGDPGDAVRHTPDTHSDGAALGVRLDADWAGLVEHAEFAGREVHGDIVAFPGAKSVDTIIQGVYDKDNKDAGRSGKGGR